MNERADEMKKAAEHYYECFRAYQEASRLADEAKYKKENAYKQMTAAQQKMGQYLGANVSKRAFLVEGYTVLAEHQKDRPPSVTILDSDGEVG